MSCKQCKRSCRASLLCEACEKREQDVFEELGKAASNRANDQIWNSVLSQDGVSAGNTATHGPSPLASAMPMGQSLVESLKELDERFNSIPFRPAYLVMPPEMYAQIPMTTFESPEFDAPLRFKVMMDYGLRVQPYSPILYADIGGSEPRVAPVVWKDVAEPAKPSALIWCVVVAFLVWLMCAAASVL